MIRTLEQRVRYDDSQCLRRLEFDGEIIPRGLVRSEQARTISTDSTMNSMSGSTPLNVPFAITPTAGVGRLRKFEGRVRSAISRPHRAPRRDVSGLEIRRHAFRLQRLGVSVPSTKTRIRHNVPNRGHDTADHAGEG